LQEVDGAANFGYNTIKCKVVTIDDLEGNEIRLVARGASNRASIGISDWYVGSPCSLAPASEEKESPSSSSLG
jgi:hypothetical protein